MQTPEQNQPSAVLLHVLGDKELAKQLIATRESNSYPSVLEIAQGSPEQLMKMLPSLAIAEARAIHQRAASQAVVIARKFREQRLTAKEVRTDYRTGVRALVDGPTFEGQFKPSWASNCAPGAIESSSSPVAYLTALYQHARDLEGNDEGSMKIKLADRRSDLAALTLDYAALNRVQPTIVTVNEILDTAARAHLKSNESTKDLSVDDALLDTRYPFNLPYERYQHQINYVLDQADLSLGDVIAAVDPAYPYFKEPGLHSLLSDVALIQHTKMGPKLQALLQEAPYAKAIARGARHIDGQTGKIGTEADEAGFFTKHYGVGSAAELFDTVQFCLRTGLDQPGLEALLSMGEYAPTLSASVEAAPKGVYGAVFINNGDATRIGIETTGGDVHTLMDLKSADAAIELSLDTFDRIQRFIRLARWLDLSFADADRLLVALIHAERHGAKTDPQRISLEADYWISSNTLRGLGLFQRLRRDHKVSAEDFAALVDGLSVQARGKDISQFDRIFNSKTLFPEALTLDDKEFPIDPAPDHASYSKVQHLASALGLPYETYIYLARIIASTDTLSTRADGVIVLKWTLPVVSAFYRLARLPTYLGLTSIEAVALLDILNEGSPTYIRHLAMLQPKAATYTASATTDVLSVISALEEAAAWCKRQSISILWLHQHLLSLAPDAVATEREADLLRQLTLRLTPTLVTEGVVAAAQLPALKGKPFSDQDGESATQPGSWLIELSEFIDRSGVILEPDFVSAENSFAESLKNAVEAICKASGILEISVITVAQVAVEQMVMNARGAQDALLHECLGDFFGVTADMSSALLSWRGDVRSDLLIRLLSADQDKPLIINELEGKMLADLRLRAEVVQQLKLSTAAVRVFQDNPIWFGQDNNNLTFPAFYALANYVELNQFARQPEESILEYLRLVNSKVLEDISPVNRRLVSEEAAYKVSNYFGFGVRDVLQLTESFFVGDNQYFRTTPQLARMLRLSNQCDTTSLGFDNVLALGLLKPISSVAQFRDAAEQALSRLSSALPSQSGLDNGEQGQSETSMIEASATLLIPNKRPSGNSDYRSDENISLTLTMTVRTLAGEIVENAMVTWRAEDQSLVTLAPVGSGASDKQGLAKVVVTANKKLGFAKIFGFIGLTRKIAAPVITLDAEESQMVFSHETVVADGPDQSPEQNAPETDANTEKLLGSHRVVAGNKGYYTLGLTMRDTWGNPGRDRLVNWYTDLGQYSEAASLTDMNGRTSVTLRSNHPSDGLKPVDAYAEYDKRIKHTFAGMVFEDRPYFKSIVANKPLIASQKVDLRCEILKIDGQPITDLVDVTWSVNGVETETLAAVSGVCVYSYTCPAAGSVTISVAVKKGITPLPSTITQQFLIIPAPKVIDQSSVEKQDYLNGQAEPLKLWVQLDQNVADIEVVWQLFLAPGYSSSSKPLQSVKTKTESNGRGYVSWVIDDLPLNDYFVKAVISENASELFNIVVGEVVFRFVPPTDYNDGFIEKNGVFVMPRRNSSNVLRISCVNGSKVVAGISLNVSASLDKDKSRGTSIVSPINNAAITTNEFGWFEVMLDSTNFIAELNNTSFLISVALAGSSSDPLVIECMVKYFGKISFVSLMPHKISWMTTELAYIRLEDLYGLGFINETYEIDVKYNAIGMVNRYEYQAHQIKFEDGSVLFECGLPDFRFDGEFLVGASVDKLLHIVSPKFNTLPAVRNLIGKGYYYDGDDVVVYHSLNGPYESIQAFFKLDDESGWVYCLGSASVTHTGKDAYSVGFRVKSPAAGLSQIVKFKIISYADTIYEGEIFIQASPFSSISGGSI